MTGGSPSLRRRVMTVTRTTLVNGSVFSSQAFSSSCSAETTAPSLRSSTSRTANSLGAQQDAVALDDHRMPLAGDLDALGDRLGLHLVDGLGGDLGEIHGL